MRTNPTVLAREGGEAGELPRVVRAEDGDLTRVVASEDSQSVAGHDASRDIGLCSLLDRVEDGVGKGRGLLDLAVIHVRVARVQQPPSVVVAHGDARVSRRVAGQRHQQHLARQPLRPCHAWEAEPLCALLHG